MSKKKNILFIFAVVAVISSVVLFFTNRGKDFSSFIAVGCSVENYSQQQDIGYVTIKFDHVKNTTKTLKVKDKELQKKLQQTNLSDIIGANMIITIPAKKLKSIHMDFKNLNAFDLLYGTNQYDNYISVTDIFLK